MIHEHYDQLNDVERIRVDNAFANLRSYLATHGLLIAGDDRSEHVVDAIAKGILESRSP